MKNDFNKKFEILKNKYVTESDFWPTLEELELLCENYLDKYPTDYDVKLKFALVVNALKDTPKAINVLKQLVDAQSSNIKALLILANILHYEWGGIDEETRTRLEVYANYKDLSTAPYPTIVKTATNLGQANKGIMHIVRYGSSSKIYVV